MAVTIDWSTKVISIPQADLTLISGSLYEMDTEGYLRAQLHLLQESEPGIVNDDIFIHNTEVTVAGNTFARTIEIINGYSLQFTPDTQWTVRLVGSNNNVFDVENGILVQNQVQVISANSAGLISVDALAAMLRNRATRGPVDPSSPNPTVPPGYERVTVYRSDKATIFVEFDVDDTAGAGERDPL